MIVLVPLILIPIVAWLTARWPVERTARLDRILRSARAPMLLGIVSALGLWWTWGSLNPVEVVHDETAYLLQAAMLARGHLVGPPRILPEFFEQFHVFVTPVLATKYPPGFALALVPGIWLGLPGLMPVILIGVSGALIFALGRRLATPAVGVLAWALWFLAPGSIPFRHLIMSETLTTALWLAGWWCLLEWRDRGSTRWLLALAFTVAWCVLTRPLTGAAYGLTSGVAVLLLTRDRNRARQLVPAAAVAIAVLAILPWQNHAVTGHWSRTAWTVYTAMYAPADKFGFGYDSTPPARELPPDIQDYAGYHGQFHLNYVPQVLPQTFLDRTAQVFRDAWGPMAPLAAILAGLGLAAGGGTALIATVTALLLMLLQLGYAHPSEWSIYYEDVVPVLEVLTAIGAARLIGLIGARVRRETAPAGLAPTSGPALMLLALALVCTTPNHLHEARRNYTLLSDYHRHFREKVAALPGRTIVFVRYARNHIFHNSLISNPADLAGAPSWIVYDRGADNARLRAAAPDRKAYLYVEKGEYLTPMVVEMPPAP